MGSQSPRQRSRSPLPRSRSRSPPPNRGGRDSRSRSRSPRRDDPRDDRGRSPGRGGGGGDTTSHTAPSALETIHEIARHFVYPTPRSATVHPPPCMHRNTLYPSCERL